MILIVLTGILVMQNAPVQMTPDVDQAVISVTTRWENASPQEIESEVVDKQEEKLQGVTGLRSLTSTCQLGQGQIRLELAFGTDINVALREVSDKMREVPAYPQNVDEPVIEATDPESTDYIAWFGLRAADPDYDIRKSFDYMEDRVKPRLESIPGMSEVNILGGREREVQVRFHSDDLALRNITLSRFVSALRRANLNVSGGAVPQGKANYRIRTLGRFSSPQQVLDTAIRSGDEGTVHVRDVAEVVETFKEAEGFVRTAGLPTMAMNFQKEPGANVIKVMETLRSEVEKINAVGGPLDTYARANGIEGGISMTQLYDQTEYVFQAVDLVQGNILLGGALAVIVLVLFLRSLRSVGIIALAIPISVFGGLAILIMVGRSINVISLAGLAFAIGMVVDNAIVVLENIYRHLEMGKKPVDAAIDGAREVGGAVLASTLTTVVVFIPVLLIQDIAGQLFADIAIAIMASVGLSFIVSLTVIPSASNLVLRHRRRDATQKMPSKTRELLKLLVAPILVVPDLIERVMTALLDSWIGRGLVAVVFLVITGFGIYLLVPPLDYLPSGNRNIAFGLMVTPPGYNLEKLEELGDRVESTIRPFFEAGSARFSDPFARDRDEQDVPQEILELRKKLPRIPSNPFNPASPKITPPTLQNYFFVARGGRLFHGAISDDPRRAGDLVSLLQTATRSEVLPDVLSFAFQFPVFRIGGNSGSAVKVDISGQEGDQVRASAGALFAALSQTFQPRGGRVQPNPSNFAWLTPELQVVPNELKMSDVGLSTEDIGLTVAANGDGVFVGEYDMDNTLVDMRVIADDAVDAESIGGMPQAPTATPYGRTVELGDVADFSWKGGPDQIRRVGRQRAVTLEVTPPKGVPLQEAMGQIDGIVRDFREKGAIPPSIDVEKTGSAGKLNEIKRALIGSGGFTGLFTGSMFFAGLVVYLLMCVLFQSWLYPLIIMVSVPLATCGGFIGLAIVHEMSLADRYLPVQNLDVLTILGFVILAGVVVNNAILIVAQTLNILKGEAELTEEDRKDMTIGKAIAVAVKSRVRPIFMSMLTSVGGMMPLVLAPGAGSELYRGLGAVIVGGLMVSTLFTLVLTPVLLSMLMDIKAAITGAKSLVTAREGSRA